MSEITEALRKQLEDIRYLKRCGMETVPIGTLINLYEAAIVMSQERDKLMQSNRDMRNTLLTVYDRLGDVQRDQREFIADLIRYYTGR